MPNGLIGSDGGDLPSSVKCVCNCWDNCTASTSITVIIDTIVSEIKLRIIVGQNKNAKRNGKSKNFPSLMTEDACFQLSGLMVLTVVK